MWVLERVYQISCADHHHNTITFGCDSGLATTQLWNDLDASLLSWSILEFMIVASTSFFSGQAKFTWRNSEFWSSIFGRKNMAAAHENYITPSCITNRVLPHKRPQRKKTKTKTDFTHLDRVQRVHHAVFHDSSDCTCNNNKKKSCEAPERCEISYRSAERDAKRRLPAVMLTPKLVTGSCS